MLALSPLCLTARQRPARRDWRTIWCVGAHTAPLLLTVMLQALQPAASVGVASLVLDVIDACEAGQRSVRVVLL
jgi:hypothetical protein